MPIRCASGRRCRGSKGFTPRRDCSRPVAAATTETFDINARANAASVEETTALLRTLLLDRLSLRMHREERVEDGYTVTMAGVHVVRTPPSAPNCNAYAERFVRSIKEECLDRIVPLGERHLRTALQEFAAHYHRERNHQGLVNELIEGPPAQRATGAVRWRQRVGGLLNFARNLNRNHVYCVSGRHRDTTATRRRDRGVIAHQGNSPALGLDVNQLL